MKKRTFIDFKKQLYISLLRNCNWKCSYCDTSETKTSNISVEKIIDTIELINKYVDNNTEICIEGGEIGLLKADDLQKIFEHIKNETVTVTTNGLFLEKGYHELFQSRIHYILYHCCEDVYPDTEIKTYNTSNIEIDYTVVIHSKNYHYCIDLFKRYNNITFMPHLLQPRKFEYNNFLTNEDIYYIYENIKNLDNIKQTFRERLLKIVKTNEKRKETLRKFCANCYTQLLIDVQNQRINRCCISLSGDYIELNESNLKKTLNNEKVFPLQDSICNNCIANFMWHESRFSSYMKKILKCIANNG